MNMVAKIVEKSGFQNNFEKFWLRKISIQVILNTSRNPFNPEDWCQDP